MHEISQKSLYRKERDSIYVIREALACCQRPALLWSLGKDSTALLHLVRKACLGRVPMPVIHLDTGAKFPEMYAFRDHWAEAWNLDLRVAQNEQAMARGVTCCCDEQMSCCHQLKTGALQQIVAENQFDGLLVGIRRDEHGVRAKERFFSPRSSSFEWDPSRQPTELSQIAPGHAPSNGHFRVHPLLHWSEIDVWSYTKYEALPVVELYLAQDGKRYRSLGCQPATEPVESSADSIDAIITELQHTRLTERTGRAQDKESPQRMERLRSLGYL